jgi:nicotinate-nucleotide adenylyltransferase
MRGIDYQLPSRVCFIVVTVKQHIGIYSGTFDPIHNGHITFAIKARNTCELSEVFFMPEPQPRLKNSVTSLKHRIALIETAIAGIDGLSILEPTSQRFSVNTTLPMLHNAFQAAHLTLLMGSDIVKSLASDWQELTTLLSDVSLAIGLRANDTRDEITAILTKLEQDLDVKIDYKIVDTTDTQVASSKVRQGIAELSHLNPKVTDYIREHNLYTKR